MKNEHTLKGGFNDLVNGFIMDERWQEAKSLLESELENSPNDHWLLTQLSEVYYEMRAYDKALELSAKAVELSPECPLAMNDHALHLYIHERDSEAIVIWTKLLNTDLNEIAYGNCGEGMRFAKSLFNDVRMRMGLSFLACNQNDKALAYFEDHLSNRRRGLFSNFSKREVLKKISEVKRQIE